MKLSNKEIQPYRIWYQYLQTALNDKKHSKKVDTKYYKDWHLKLVKKLTFNQWIKQHEHLFIEKEPEIKLFDSKRTPNSILVEIPISLNVVQVRDNIGKVIKGKIAKSQTHHRFKIQANRPLQTVTFDYFLWTYEFRQKNNKYTNEEIWVKVDEKVKERQKKVAKQIANYKKTGKGIRPRIFAGWSSTKDDNNRKILVSRNITKAQNILTNVCKGIFPGTY